MFFDSEMHEVEEFGDFLHFINEDPFGFLGGNDFQELVRVAGESAFIIVGEKVNFQVILVA